MQDSRKTPDEIAEELRNNPQLAEGAAVADSNRVACLSYMSNGYLKLSWASSLPGKYDWVGLYKSTSDPDSNYIGGAWQWVSGNSSYETSIVVNSGYEARYLVWDSTNSKYVNVARTGAFPAPVVRSVPTGVPRSPTSAEWSELVGNFPSLQYSDVKVTGPTNTGYNCIAWSIGFNDRWINPDSPLSRFQAQYQSFGRKSVGRLASVASVDGWATSNGECTHGSKLYAGVSVGQSGLWESKLGSYLRITHGRVELKGAAYGSVVDSFQLSFGLELNEGVSMASQELWSEEDELKLQIETQSVPLLQRSDFEKAFSAWEATWNAGTMAFSSDTRDRAKGPEFDALVAMGPPIVPLVIDKLRDPSNFIALVLYDALQDATALVTRYTGDEPVETLLEGEQGRAQRTIKLWLSSR